MSIAISHLQQALDAGADDRPRCWWQLYLKGAATFAASPSPECGMAVHA